MDRQEWLRGLKLNDKVMVVSPKETTITFIKSVTSVAFYVEGFRFFFYRDNGESRDNEMRRFYIVPPGDENAIKGERR